MPSAKHTGDVGEVAAIGDWIVQQGLASDDLAGLLSGFCLMSSLRDWWAHYDGRKIRSYALAVAVAVICTQFLAGADSADASGTTPRL